MKCCVTSGQGIKQQHGKVGCMVFSYISRRRCYVKSFSTQIFVFITRQGNKLSLRHATSYFKLYEVD